MAVGIYNARVDEVRAEVFEGNARLDAVLRDSAGNIKQVWDDCFAGITDVGWIAHGNLVVTAVPPATEWGHIALGTGTGQEVSDTALDAETDTAGLARVPAHCTGEVLGETASDDLVQVSHVFTARASEAISEVGVFNALVGGEMLMYAPFSPVAEMESGDTLTLALKCQIKAAA